MKYSLKLLSLSALLAAMTIVLTTFIKIPIGNGYVHLGDSVIYLASCTLPFPYALFVAATGGALSDALSGYVIYIIPSLVIKALITLPFSAKSAVILTKRNAFMLIPAGLIGITGYFAAGLFFFGKSGAIIGVYGDVMQAIGSSVLFLVFAAALDKIRFKENIIKKATTANH